ncbi:MAG: tetratricopeptide repeat protein [Candidatus Zixiibacteriota bacterium]|nr:MAG: tetratricopeptide repeat protein [candidate division Zixibacteria bacterium]
MENKEPNKHSILNFYGVAGIGKTALRYKLIEELKDADEDAKLASIDFKTWKNPNIEDSIYWLRKEFKDISKNKIEFPVFDIGYAALWKKKRPQIELNEESFPLWKELGPVAEIIGSIFDVSSAGLLPKIAKYIDRADKAVSDRSTKRSSAVLREYLDMEAHEMEDYLPALFAEDIKNYWEDYNYKIVLFFDSYERQWDRNYNEATMFIEDEWIRLLIKKLPEAIFVTCGQEKIRWEEQDSFWGDILEQHKLGDLPDDEIEKIIRNRNVKNEPVINAIKIGSKGVPLAANVAVDDYFRIRREENRESAPDEFGTTPDSIYIKFIEHRNSGEIKTLRLLSIANIWNRDIYEKLLAQFPTGYSIEFPPDLVHYSCVEMIAGKSDESERQFTIHELLRKCVYENLEKNKPDYLTDIHKFLFEYYIYLLKEIDIKNITDEQKNGLAEGFYHGKYVIESEKFSGLLNGLFYKFHAGAQWKVISDIYSEAIGFFINKFGKENYHVALALNNLALSLGSQGRYKKAEPLYKDAIAIYKKALREDHPYCAAALNNLALLYLSQDRYEEAEPLFIESLEIKKKAQLEEHPDYAKTLNNLAALYDSQDRYRESEPLYIKSLEIQKKALGDDHPDYASTLNNLALLYGSQGRHEEAEPLYIKSLEINRKTLGDNHPEFAITLGNLAMLYKERGKYNNAENGLKNALEIFENKLGPEHPHVATTLKHLSILYDKMGREEESAECLARAQAIRQKLGETE